MRIRLLRPHRRDKCRGLVALAAALAAQAAMVGILLWVPVRPAPIVSHAPAPRGAVTSTTLAYVTLPSPSGAASHSVSSRALHDPRAAPDSVTRGGASIAGARSTSETDAAVGVGGHPAGLLDNPFMGALDSRLLASPAVDADSLNPLRRLRAAALAVARAEERAASATSAWTVGSGDVRVGLSPGRLHLGRIVIPQPLSIVVLRDVDPRVRHERSMLREVHAQRDQYVRDSTLRSPRRR